MKKKVFGALILLISLFICCSCSVANSDGYVEESQKLQIFKTDLQLSQEQVMSQIKAEHLLENKGYLPNDELVILINLNKESLIETYNSTNTSNVKSVGEYATSLKGMAQIKEIQNEQNNFIEKLQRNNLIISVENTYNTIMNAIAVKTTYSKFLEISKLSDVKSVVMSDTYNLPKEEDRVDASAIKND